MFVSQRRFGTAILAGLALLAATAVPAQAQRRGYPPGVSNMYPSFINPNPQIAPGLTLQQYTYNVQTLARAYSTIPPYLLGYNPYPTYAAPGYPTYPTVPSYPGYPSYPAYNPALTTAYNPYVGNPYVGASPATMGAPSLTTTPGYDPSLSTYGNPYAGNPYSDPSYGALRGLADLTNANAQWYVTIQRGKLMQEEVTRSRLETRRRILEEAERERKAIPNPEDQRQKDIENAVNRARRDPPLTELLAGKSLNDLLNYLSNQQARGFRGPKVELDDIDLSQINVAPVNEAGNIGLVKNLKQGDELPWPSLLLNKPYGEARENLDKRLPAAVIRLRTQKPVPESDIRDMEEDVKKMTETLNASIGDLSPSQYITAKRFLNQVQDAITAMRSPGAVNYFDKGAWVARGKNVAELVHNMKGLKFAPATPGTEGSYRALHQALVAFDATMAKLDAKP